MKQIELAKATGSLAEYARNVRSGPVVVTVNGKPTAALVSIDNADLETISLSTNPDFIAIIERSRNRQKALGGLSSAQVRHRLRSKRARTK